MRGGLAKVDFKRIELIFLLTFLSLNIFLIYSYFGKTDTLSYESIESTSTVPFEEMKKDGVKFDADQFSDEKLLVPYIKAKNENLLNEKVEALPKDASIMMEDDKQTLYRSLAEPLVLFSDDKKFNSKNIKIYAEKLDAYIMNQGIIAGDEYSFFKYSASQNAFIYTQKAKGFRILDGTGRITFHLDGGKVIAYEQTYAGEISVTGKSRNLISEKNAIEALYQNNEFTQGSVISEKPKLGYYQTLSLPKDGIGIYGPVWYVVYKNGNEEKVRLVNAIDGTIIRNNSKTTNENDANGVEQEDIIELE